MALLVKLLYIPLPLVLGKCARHMFAGRLCRTVEAGDEIYFSFFLVRSRGWCFDVEEQGHAAGWALDCVFPRMPPSLDLSVNTAATKP